ncbi:MAG: type VI secretion system contractile sheath large subunit [Phycisphaeraceae bacterium]|nr:MAG: type VI secretion system contractile sheath large subunit [Phycisphaeraceae bacterium]
MNETGGKQDSTAASTPQPGSLIADITEATGAKRQDEDFAPKEKRLGTAIAAILEVWPSANAADRKLDRKLVDRLIAECDQRLGAQIDAILHNSQVQALESTWRGLKLLCDRTDFRENIRIDILSCTKDELAEDFADAPEVMRTGLYGKVYKAELGQFGGDPYGAIVTDYYFGPSSRDIALLRDIAAVGAMSHAPVLAGAGPQFFGKESFEDMDGIGDLSDVITPENPTYSKWFGFRETQDARYVGLAMPRILLRKPYNPEDNPNLGFNYDENVSEAHNDYLWGNASFAFATRLSESFAKYRWCANIIGPQSGGAVDNLPVHTFESGGRVTAKVPTEIYLPDARDMELSEQGFIPLLMRKHSDNAAFFGAPSTRMPLRYPSDKDSETNEKLGCQLPYMFIISRLAHYIKVIQRENIGRGYSREQFHSDLEKWLRKYVAANVTNDPKVMATKPLKAAQIEVTDIPGEPGWYRVHLRVSPHFKYQGAYFELSLVGRLETDEK